MPCSRAVSREASSRRSSSMMSRRWGPASAMDASSRDCRWSSSSSVSSTGPVQHPAVRPLRAVRCWRHGGRHGHRPPAARHGGRGAVASRFSSTRTSRRAATISLDVRVSPQGGSARRRRSRRPRGGPHGRRRRVAASRDPRPMLSPPASGGVAWRAVGPSPTWTRTSARRGGRAPHRAEPTDQDYGLRETPPATWRTHRWWFASPPAG